MMDPVVGERERQRVADRLALSQPLQFLRFILVECLWITLMYD